MSLFSIFDPMTGPASLSANWLALGGVLLIPSSYWVSSGRGVSLPSCVLRAMNSEIQAVNYKTGGSSVGLILTSVLSVLVANNFLGLLPYVFTATSHTAVTLPLGLSLWSGLTLYAAGRNPSSLLAHLVPGGTPPPLVPFMVIIELTSSVIRPLTLAVRLAANMIAGHLILALVSGPVPASGPGAGLTSLAALMSVMALEMGVALIQSYVFVSLICLYLGEVNLNNL